MGKVAISYCRSFFCTGNVMLMLGIDGQDANLLETFRIDPKHGH